jgi:hypothetical protein
MNPEQLTEAEIKQNHVLVDWILAKVFAKIETTEEVKKEIRDDIHKGIDNIIELYNEDVKNETD